MPAKRYEPNRLLAWQRLQHGWSYEELAAQIRRSMRACDETDTGLNANTVRRWETGERWPEPRYRKHLVMIFNMSAAELGLLTPEELQLRPDNDVNTDLRRYLDVAAEAAGVNRATVLRSLAGLAALPALMPLISLVGQAGTPPNNAAAEPYQQVTRHHRALYWTCAPQVLFEPVYAHAQLGVALLRNGQGPNSTLLGNALAETAMLAGRLAFFDLHQPALASRCYDVALAASRETGDHALAAAALGHMAFLPAFSGDITAARELIAAALQHTWHGVDPTVRSWLHCVASEADAQAGDTTEALRHIELASATADTEAGRPDWMDFYNDGRRHAFAGYASLAADDKSGAATSLNACLGALGEQDAKQRSVVLADLAAAHIDDPDRSSYYLGQALDAMGDAWYGTGLDRIRQHRAALGDSRHGIELDDRIDTLSSAVRPSITGG